MTGDGKRRKLAPWIDSADRAAVICLILGFIGVTRGLLWLTYSWGRNFFTACIAILGAVILAVGIVLAIVVKRATK